MIGWKEETLREPTHRRIRSSDVGLESDCLKTAIADFWIFILSAVGALPCFASLAPYPATDAPKGAMAPYRLTAGKYVHAEAMPGLADGTLRLSKGRVEVSGDGKLWSRAGSVSQKTGNCASQQRTPIRFLRLLPEPRAAETLAVREIVVK